MWLSVLCLRHAFCVPYNYANKQRLLPSRGSAAGLWNTEALQSVCQAERLLINCLVQLYVTKRTGYAGSQGNVPGTASHCNLNRLQSIRNFQADIAINDFGTSIHSVGPNAQTHGPSHESTQMWQLQAYQLLARWRHRPPSNPSTSPIYSRNFQHSLWNPEIN